MYSGESLFFANNEGNLDEDQLRIVFDWTEEFKHKRLQKVSDPHARNLISRLLMKDPSKRPDVSHALAHPFLTGKRAARMIGDEALYDVFLSYRVSSDSHHCELMHEMLTEKGLRVWWDKKCLQPGVDWEEGFCEGLINSRAFVPLLSRAGLERFKNLTESSPCDNVLLEYRLALELQSLNLIEFVFPVMIGDSSADSNDPRACNYTAYFKSGCQPKCPEINVKSVEEKLREQLNNQGLGDPLTYNPRVKDIYQSLSKHQGGFIQGTGGDAFSAVVDSIHSMIKPAGAPPNPVDGNESYSVISSKLECNFCVNRLTFLKTKLDLLWSGINKIKALITDTACNIDAIGQITNSNISKVWNKYIFLFYSIKIYISYAQDVAHDAVDSVQSNIVNAINAVQELRQYVDLDLERAEKLTQTATINTLNAAGKKNISQTGGNRSVNI